MPNGNGWTSRDKMFASLIAVLIVFSVFLYVRPPNEGGSNGFAESAEYETLRVWAESTSVWIYKITGSDSLKWDPTSTSWSPGVAEDVDLQCRAIDRIRPGECPGPGATYPPPPPPPFP